MRALFLDYPRRRAPPGMAVVTASFETPENLVRRSRGFFFARRAASFVIE